jgi:hypothetical protein
MMKDKCFGGEKCGVEEREEKKVPNVSPSKSCSL